LIEARMADPAAYAQAQVDEWQKRIKAGGSARPSPTDRDRAGGRLRAA